MNVSRIALVAVFGLTVFGCAPSTTGFDVSPKTESVERGKTVQVSATALQSDQKTVDVTETAEWSSSDPAIATVSKGTVTGVGIGSATITATFIEAGKSFTASAELTVTAPPPGTVIVTPTMGLTTTESGGTATFTIALSTAPISNVTIGLSSSDPAEGTVSPMSVTFTPMNWNAPQTVTVTGVEDMVADGAKTYTIVTAKAVSDDVVFKDVDGPDVAVSNTDNDTAGVTVTPTTGLTTTEAGGTATFTVVLNTRPTANVTVGLSSSDTSEGTVAPAALSFTMANWNAPQTVTVTGVDDAEADGATTYNIVTAAASSTDTRYNGVNGADVAVSNTDNDSAGVTVTPTTGLNTTEAGGTATFTVVLNSQPTANVTIGLTSSRVTEGTVSPAALTFTAVNWNAAQMVTVTGVDDSVADGNQMYSIVTAAATSTDMGYNGVNAADVAMSNTDNDSAGITVTPTMGLTTTEAGGAATFTVVLNSQPTANVTIGLSSSRTTEGTVAPAALTFTAANWNAPQTVTVTGVNDPVADGNQMYSILTAAATSTDLGYNGVNAADVTVSNTDNDSAGVTVNPTTGLTTTEAGGTATFTVVLNSQPTANVTIGLSSSRTTEGAVSPAALTFTTANWNALQTVTVTGVNDPVADGNQTYTIVTAAATSTDTGYNNLNAADVTVSNTDNDSAGVTVNPTTGLTTTEAGGTAAFTVVLNSQPTANVTIGLTSSRTAEGTVSPAALTFTTANWNALQTVTVTGVDDSVADGNQTYTIVTAAATSTDTGYNNLNAADVTVSNTDNDSAGITVNPTTGLTTTEAGGTAAFTVVLNSQPTASVTIGLTSSRTTEGTVSPVALTFTTANWNASQTVTVTGVNDPVADGNQTYTIVTAAATSTDTGYNGVNAADVTVSNTDNDSAGITVNPTTGLTTTEAGGTAAFTVVLNSQPTANVTIGLTSSRTAEGTVSPAALTFTTANWNALQTVTVTGVNDPVADGNQTYTIVTAAATSTDTGYNNLNAADVTVSNTDNDSAGITVSPTTGLTTTEAGGTAAFTVVLNSQPTANVTIGLTSSRTAEGTVSPAALTFTTANWNALQTVTVTGVNDPVADGNQTYTIVTAAATSTDTGYNNLNAADVTVSNTDNDSAGITVNPTTGLTTTEAGGTAAFTVVLNSQPTANVTIGLTSSLTTEGTVSPAALTFTTANWNALQTVTVTGVNDPVADGNQTYTIVTAAATSTDTGYSGVNAADVTVSNTDNDSAGVTVNPTTGLTTTEAGGTAAFTVVLNSQPTASVTIGLTSSRTTEGTVSPAALTFSTANWNAPQTVTVTGVNDPIADGNQTYTIVTAAATSTDTGYNGVNAADVTVSNTDNDSAGITVNPTTGLTTTEAGGTAAFTVVLNSQPTASVTIGLTSSRTAEGTVSPAALTFSTANWNAPQTVTVTGVNDPIADGNQTYTIVTAAATSTDTGYNGVNAADVTVSNTDNDSAGVTVNPTTGLTTTEAGGTATFTVVLNSQPTANVTIGLTSSRTTEGTVSPAALTFTTANWNSPRTVTVTGVDDSVIDGNQVYSIITAAATSTDTGYNGVNAADVGASNTDNDSAGVAVSPSSITTTESGGTGAFTIVLTSQPSAAVTIALSSSNVTEATVSPSSVTFTTVNWNAPQTVTVTGVDDAVADGAVPFAIVTAAAVSADMNYSNFNGPDVTGSNTDNDSAGVTVFPTAGLSTDENGGVALFSIVLNSQPTANVTIPLSSSDSSEGTVSPAAVTFTAANWNAPQFVTVTGVDDAIQDGSQPYSIITGAATSSDLGYAGFNAVDVSVSNVDNDTPGISVVPSTGLTTTEAGGTGSFSVVLNSQPTASVTIDISSSDTTEGAVSPASITFTTVNWNAPQTITVTGVDDSLADGNQVYAIITAAADSADLGYAGLQSSDVSATNTDNDTAGITVNPTTGLTTTEAGVTDSFTVVLNSQPTASVTIGLSSSSATEGSVSSAALTFTTANWNAPQTVTVTGVNDSVADGNQPYTIVTAPATSADTTGYNGLNAADVSATNVDNDSAGITVSPTTGLTTTEAGGTDSFTVVLNSQPTTNVTLALSSSRTAEGSVAPASLTFTSLNWNAPQTVTVTGVDDSVADGAQPYTIVTAPLVSGDPNYQGIDPSNVSVSNTDNDSAGITVSAISTDTTEAGGTATFTIVLNSQPTANVTVGASSSDTTEGTLGPASLTFTALNWSAPQTVTVAGVNDAVADGDQPYNIVIAAASSSDSNYNGFDATDITGVLNIDDDSAGITVNPTSGLTTTEAGGAATFTVVLNSQPTANVTIGLSSNNTNEGTVSPASLTFTSANWNALQTVTVTGFDDLVADGNQPYSIVTAAATSTDTGYSGVNPADVAVSNTDNDSAGVTVSPTTGLTTTEAGGTATFTIALNSQPTADVTIGLTSTRTAEGTVSPAALTFTAVNWNAPQTVTVTGADDSVADGNQTYGILTAAATSLDTGYNNLSVADVTVSNTDNDSAGITVTPTTGLTTTEALGTATFTVVLNSQPTADVTIPLSSSTISEGVVSPASLTFTSSNWNAPQTVTATGVDDSVADGNQSYTIVTAAATSTDTGYAGINAADVSVSNTDNDSAGITVTPTTGLITTEAGGTAPFTVVLNSQPTANVTIGLSSSRTTEGTVSPVALTFTAVNWNAPQTVTVTGVNDLVADGNQPLTIVTAAAVSIDSNYSGRNPADVTVTNNDDDVAGFIITPSSGLNTTEGGGVANFTVRLNSQPTASVTIGLSSSDTGEGTVSTAALTYTTANWNVPQFVTVTGVDDALRDGNQPYTIVTAAAVSSDSGYSGLNPIDVSVTNQDNDSPGVVVTPTSGLVTTEAGGTASFTIVLSAAPTANVTVNLSSSDLTEGTPTPASLVFTTANWNTAQTISVLPIDDFDVDGNQPYSIVTAPLVSTDTGYSGLDPANVSCTNTDND